MEVRLVWCRERWRFLFVPVVQEAQAQVTEYDPPLSEYLVVKRSGHVLTAQVFHQRIGFQGIVYDEHGHVIRDTDSEEDKNRLAAHIDAYHPGGQVG